MRYSIKLFLLLLCWQGIAQEHTLVHIDINGLKKSKPQYLKRLLTQKIGQAYDSIKVKNDLIVLLREPAVSHAFTSIDTLSSGRIKLTYHIEENKTLIPAVDLWQTVNNAFAYHLGLTDYNFTGRGYTLGAFYRQNNFPGFGLIVENNNFMSAKTELKLLAQQLETLEPIRLKTGLANFRYRFQSCEISLGREINLKHKVMLGAGLIGERYLFEEGDDIANVPKHFTTTKGVGKLGYTYDYIQPHYYHLNGWRSQTYATHVWGKSITDNNTFYTIENETKYFKRINKMGNLAIRGQLGLARNIDSPFSPFVIDNNRNVRGVGNLVQRGNAYWAINTEYRHTLFEKGWFALQGNTFIDIAGIQPVDSKLSQLFKSENNYQYGGIGFRFIHKYIYKAVLRIDYGINLDGFKNSSLVFGIDQFF